MGGSSALRDDCLVGGAVVDEVVLIVAFFYDLWKFLIPQNYNFKF